MLQEEVLFVAGIVESRPALPWQDCEDLATHFDRIVDIVHHDGIVAFTTLDHGTFKEIFNILDDGAGSKAITGVRKVEIRIIFARLVDQAITIVVDTICSGAAHPVDEVLFRKQGRTLRERHIGGILIEGTDDEIVVKER